jgi:molybdate transport system permease protein
MFEFSPTDLQAMQLSARVAFTATLVSLPFGFLMAYMLVFTKIPIKPLINGLVNLPLVLPPVVVGYLLLLSLGNRSWLGELLAGVGIHIIFTWKAAVLASMVVGFPLLVRSICIGMEDIDERLLQAAQTLGACRYDTLLTIILPLSTRAIIAGATLMFARSLGEFGATIILAGNIPGVTQTIPLAIYDYTSTPGGDRMALGLCLVSIMLALVVLLFDEGVGKGFRRRRQQ